MKDFDELEELEDIDELELGDDVDVVEEGGEMYEHKHLEVEPGQKSMRIDKYLSIRLPSTSRNRIQTAAEGGCVYVNGKPVRSSYKIKPNDDIKIMLSFPKRETGIVPQDLPLDVVYEDDDLIVVNKAAGMVVHPSFGHFEGTLVNALAYRFKDLPMFNAETFRPGLVHRIDMNTSGLLVVAVKDLQASSSTTPASEPTMRSCGAICPRTRGQSSATWDATSRTARLWMSSPMATTAKRL